MANITKIREFVAGGTPITSRDHSTITVYYDSGRRYEYKSRDTLPATVVEYLTSEETTAETTYIEDTFNHTINKRTIYRQTRAAILASDTAQEPAEAPQSAEEQQPATVTATERREALERLNAQQNAANRFTNITPADVDREAIRAREAPEMIHPTRPALCTW